jgi:hypothetical protein
MFCVLYYNVLGSRNIAVGIATGYGLDGRRVGVHVTVEARFSLSLHVVQTGYGARPVSYPMGTGSSFPGGKAVRAWSWSLTFNN